MLATHKPRAILHFTAERHVDRLIDIAATFVATNVNGIFNLRKAARGFWSQLVDEDKAAFLSLPVSTNGVHGATGPSDAPLSEIRRPSA